MGISKCAIALFGAILCGGACVADAAPPKEISARSLTALMDQGEQALLAKDYKAARNAFSDVLSADPRNKMALEGATFAYFELDDYIHSKAYLERAMALSPHPTHRSAIIGASVYLRTKNPMRAVRLLIEYMTPMTSVDESALDALAVALNQTDDQARKGRLYADAVSFYAAQTKKLELKNPGLKRWGTEWLPADQADQKIAAWNATQAATTKLGRELAALKAHLAMVVRNQNDPGFIQRMEIQNYTRPLNVDPMDELNLSKLQPEVDAKQAAYDKAMQAVEHPPVADSIDPASIDVETASALASARGAVDPGGAAADSSPQSAETPSPKPRTARKPSPATTPVQVATATPPDGATPAPASTPGDAPAPADPNPPAAPPDSDAAPKKTYRVTSYAAAFPVGADLLVTAAEAVADATEIQVQVADGAAFSATVVRSDPQSGLALLRVPTAKFAWLNLADHFSGGTISCVSFPGVDLFQPAATAIAGSAVAPKSPWHVRLSETPRLGGGPLLADGKVVGVELAIRDSELGAIPAVTLDDLKKFLAADLIPGGTASDAVAATVQLTATREK